MAKTRKEKSTKNITPFDEMDTRLAMGGQKGTLGTLHNADKVGNTPAWQNRMKKNKKGQRLYDFGQDLIEKV